MTVAPRLAAHATSRPELWILTLLSAATHFWHLTSPHAFVFDEVYYEPFAGAYLTHAYMFDVHPPLGRLLFALTARLLHVPAAALMQPVPVPMLRVLPALFGTALVPLVYLLLRQLHASRRVAALGAIGILFDNGLLMMSRIAVPDIILIVLGVGALSAYLAARTRSGGTRAWWIAGAALLAGLALSIKWTGASALGLILSAWAIDSFRARRRAATVVREAALLIAIPALLYLGFFQLHFAILSHSGTGDRYMPARFLAQLPGSATYDPSAPRLSYWQKLADVHAAIRRSNAKLIGASNSASSKWYTWPFTTHPIMVWSSAPSGPDVRKLFLVGNPLVWWTAIACVVATSVMFMSRRAVFRGFEYGTVFLLAAFAINYLPFIAIRRLMYIYHYLFALTIAVGVTAWLLGLLAGWMRADDQRWRFPRWQSEAGYWSVVGVWLAGFLFFAQFTFV
ncbi:MAG TPA: phospholipid carrier-dependent glycosyltransferase [Gemmatimonadaceae bacterium]|nr:phospholipid carrier-dependent glycosyltransferase [Gemmatimonadaceae bacterium]